MQSGSAGLVLLALANCGQKTALPPIDPAYGFTVLSPSQQTVIHAVASAMLVDAFSPAQERAGALAATVRGVDVAVSRLPLGTQAEFGQLLQLLENPLTRWLTTGIGSWSDAGDTRVAAFLDRWRYSRFTLLRSGYDALHQLVMAAWYAQPAAWTAIRYPGPPNIA